MKSIKLQRLWNFVWGNLDLIVLLLTGLIFAILPSFGKTPDDKTAPSIILGALSLLAFSMIRTRTKFDKTVEKINHADVFLSQEKMYQELENYIEDHRVREAVLIQYSGQRVNRIVRQLVSQGADVILYVQAKETAQKFSNHQVDRIKQFPDFIVTEFDESAEKKKNKGTLIIHEYDPPASLRAIRIDNKILGIGWYVYTYIDKKDVKEKQQYQKFPDDDIKLLGHNQPGKLLYSGSREYDIMSILFEHFVENVDKHNKLWGKDPIFEFGTEPHE